MLPLASDAGEVEMLGRLLLLLRVLTLASLVHAHSCFSCACSLLLLLHIVVRCSMLMLMTPLHLKLRPLHRKLRGMSKH
jgi:hypothetical protein